MKAWDVMKLLTGRQCSPFAARRNYLAIPNVSWGFLSYEADLLVISKSKYATEVEVKISMSDWKADFLKYKHRRPDPRIKYQYYAAPMELAERYVELELPEGWGVVGVEDSGPTQILKPAIARPNPKKITDKELLILARLCCFRVWKKEPKETP